MTLNSPAKRWLHGAIALILLGSIAFSAFYLFSDYRHLKEWFFSLNGCLYKSAAWDINFFTSSVKSNGNLFSLLAFSGSLVGLIYLVIQFFRKSKEKEVRVISFRPGIAEMFWLLSLLVLAVLLWFLSNTSAQVAYDEAFSAVHCAGIHPFQAWSYYMLPNNHIFYNLVNNIFFHFCDDKVFTGRLISLAAYLILSLLLFVWAKKLFINSFNSLSFTLLIILQFPVWGFAAQARGYELYALAHWLACISLFEYIKTAKSSWLKINGIAAIIGFAVMPSFLYFYAAHTSFIIFYQSVNKRPDWKFWKYQFWVCFFVFLFYLPALCFSGLDSFTQNGYVTPVTDNLKDFLPQARPVIKSYVDYTFSGLNMGGFELYWALFFLPVGLLFSKRRSEWFYLGVFYIFMIASVLLFIFVMRRPPFHRTLIGQESIVLGLAAITVFRFLLYFSGLFRRKYLLWLFPLLALSLAAYFYLQNRKNLSTGLYFYDVNNVHKVISEEISVIPHGSSIWCSDESFYWYFLLKKERYHAEKCSFANQDCLILLSNKEKLPAGAEGKYKEVGQAEDYSVFIRALRIPHR